jgi:LmbE family N-acetylglucosaminyl deacetylase
MVSLVSCNTKSETDEKRAGSGGEPKTILTVFAHPDDETTMGGVLAKYGRDHEVYLLLATDGSYGVTDHMGLPPGDSLVELRKREAACSCAALGIHEPIFLGVQDGLGLNGHGNFYEFEPLLKERLLAAILEIQPDIIITFGPGGDTGHPDHRLLGAITTELLLREGLSEKIDLYYFGWTRQQAEKYPWWGLNYMDASALTTEIHFSQEDEDRAMNSIRCHKSQYRAEEMEDWIRTELEDLSNVSYFRKFQLDSRKRSEF